VLEKKIATVSNTVIEEEVDRKFESLVVQHEINKGRQHPSRASSLKEFSRLFRNTSGVNVPSISMMQMEEMIRLCQLVGLAKDRLIECGGNSCAQVIMQLLGGSPRIHPKNEHQLPTVVIFISNTQKGALGLCATHGVKIHVLQVGDVYREDTMTELHLYKSTSGALWHDLEDIPHGDADSIDMIIDALLDSSPTATSISYRSLLATTYQSCIDWINTSTAPVLSLDYPSAMHDYYDEAIMSTMNHEDGDATAHQMVDAKWIACLGLPKNHLFALCDRLPSMASCQFFLIDMGIPLLILKKLCLLTATATSPYLHDKFVVPLEIYTSLPINI
jgi:NAD(P)H-hydrate repair Nnr-like enzyme with NAD(P)H-hydrate epimerase domain